jgi:integrase
LTWGDIPTIFPTIMASIFKRPRSPFYFCSYRSGDGRWLKKSTKQTDRRNAMEFCHKLEEAERAALSHTLTTAQARKLFNEILERAGDEPLDNFTTEEWLCEWVASKKVSRGEKTATRYEKPVKDFLAHLGKRASLPLRAVTPKDVRSFRDAERKLGKSPATANLSHRIIASALGAAVRMGYVMTNPATAVDYLSTHETKAQKETFTREEIARLLEAAPSDDWRGVILLGALAGIRLGDALRLKWGNVDLQAGGITFTPSKTARLGKKLTLPLHPEIEAFLLKHPTGASDDAPLFPSLVIVPVPGSLGASMAFRGIMEQAGVAAGIAREAEEGGMGRSVSARSFHSLRHGFVTALAHANVAVELRQKLAGHASEGQSLHYTHPEFAALRTAIERLPRLS